ncbi:hypothetical protein JAAARDRAFT_42329 [Jaapia argillacea MUCL 33604]|uniref:Uncharacterized protein n=1 Tax=Jaapia argillacea MUCL 33604 TaxID=933084 RepID=A0A067P8K2_9AGAM|nr:hypothetical protein JAAARDRAFT_42329 [Jaapia argillacea MUCL 33604]
MKVTSTNGLEFGDQKLTDNAKFTVKKYDGGKVGFVGSNGKYVNMYYINDVKCEGPDGGLSVGILYLAGGKVAFTITGYQGQDGRTAFLSSQAGSAAYNGSLAVKDYPDFTCEFTIQNL